MKNATISLRKRGSQTPADPNKEAQDAELRHLLHGFQKKCDNLKVMADRLNEHGHLSPSGEAWTYETLKETLHELKLT